MHGGDEQIGADLAAESPSELRNNYNRTGNSNNKDSGSNNNKKKKDSNMNGNSNNHYRS